MTDKIANPKLVKSPLCRISYPWVFKKQQFKDGKEQYNLVMLIPKTEGVSRANKDPKMKPMYTALKAAAVEKWAGQDLAKMKLKFPVKDGDKETDKSGDPKPECTGMWVVAASSDHRPGIVEADGQTYIEEDSNHFYAGVWAFVSLNGYAWDYKDFAKRGVSFGLRNVQKVKDGERLGGITAAHDDFEPIDEDAETPDVEEEEGEDDGF